MAILLPASPLPQSITPAPIVFGGPSLGTLGGEDQFVQRLGSRFSIQVTTPRLKPEPDARLWIAALLDAWFSGEDVLMPWYQPGFDLSLPGQVVVDGGGQAGKVLVVRGGTPNYAVRHREFFSVITYGRRSLYYATAPAILDGSGGGSVPIGPMLRTSPNDGDVCEFGAPKIQGMLVGDQRQWTHARAGVQGLTFTIRERR